MSAPLELALLWFLSGVTGATVLRRLIGSSSRSEPIAPAHVNWPLTMRPFLWPARHLAGLINERLPAGYAARIRRRLEKADLHPGLSASQWTALCACIATAAGCAACIACVVTESAVALPILAASSMTWIGCERWLHRRIVDCERRIVRDLPSYLDLFTVCVEAGATLTAAARFIVEQAPDGPLRNYFDRVLREIRSGRIRSQAFVSVADTYGVECLSTLASTLSHAEAAGMSIGQVLRTQAEQRSTERFVRAERQAMQAPVKMLGPLIFCIFPCTFIVLAIPIAHRLMEAFRT
jgi:tight adherence protein C